jgi:hypothetical protein
VDPYGRLGSTTPQMDTELNWKCPCGALATKTETVKVMEMTEATKSIFNNHAKCKIRSRKAYGYRRLSMDEVP